MNRKKRCLALLKVLVVVLVLPALPACATTFSFSGARIEKGGFVVSVQTPGFLNRKNKAFLASGQPLETTIRFYLLAVRDSWWDEQIEMASLHVEVRFDAAMEEYTVTRRFGKDNVLLTKKVRSLDELKTLLEVYNDIPVFQIEPAWKGRVVYLQGRIFLGHDYLLGTIPKEKWTDEATSSRFTIP